MLRRRRQATHRLVHDGRLKGLRPRLSPHPFRKGRACRNGCRAAAHGVAHFHRQAGFEPRREPQDVAASGIGGFHRHRGRRQLADVARVAEVLDQALREFDARALPGNELLLNGSFELGKEAVPKFWLTDGAAPQLISVPQALDGQRCIQLHLKTGLRQGVALPPGAKNVELMVSARSAENGHPVSFRYQIYTLGFEKDPASIAPENQVQPERALTGKSESAMAGGEWQQYRAALAIPDLARYIVVSFDKPEGSGEVWIDSIHLYSR